MTRAVSRNLLLALEGLEHSVVGRDPVRVDVLVAERVPDPAVDNDAGARVAKGLLRVLRVVELLVAEALCRVEDSVSERFPRQGYNKIRSGLSKSAHPVDVGRAVVRLLVAIADIDVARLLCVRKSGLALTQDGIDRDGNRTHCLGRGSP